MRTLRRRGDATYIPISICRHVYDPRGEAHSKPEATQKDQCSPVFKYYSKRAIPPRTSATGDKKPNKLKMLSDEQRDVRKPAR